jgi:hypothetical protein
MGDCRVAKMKYVVRSERGVVIKGPHTFEVAAEIAGNLVRAGRIISISPCPDVEAAWEEWRQEHMATEECRAIQWTGDNPDEVAQFVAPEWAVESVMEHPVDGKKAIYVRTETGLRKAAETEYLVRVRGSLEVFPEEDVELMGNVTITTAKIDVEVTSDEDA